MTVVIDACHSGTVTRIPEEEEYIRGTSYVFAPPYHETGVIDAENFRISLKKGEGLSPVTVFSACQPEQMDYEYRSPDIPPSYYGSLTFFFCELMNRYKATDTNNSFYLRLKKSIETYFNRKNRKQTPHFESTDIENIFVIGQ